MKYKSASMAEIDHVVQLSIDTFKPNMKEQFRLLFSKQNIKHMMIAKDQDQVVSEVNYYPSTIIIPHAKIKVASIGSVCTNQRYRGQGIASRLLVMAEEQMVKEQVSLAIISGDLGIYERFGARDVGHMHHYKISLDLSQLHSEYQLKVYEPADLELMFKLYSKENIRYHRSRYEFEELFLGQTYPDSYCKYPVYLILDHNLPVAYVILSVYVEDDLMKIKEFAGDRKALVQVLQHLLHVHQKTKMTFVVPPQDPIQGDIKDIKYTEITQRATLKITHLGHFFKSIIHYIHGQYPHVHIIESSQTDITLSIEGHHIVLNQEEALTMVFNGKTRLRNRQVLSFVKSCFPLPMPWSHNLNYQ
jgi:predicted acetyltransferase